jgi:hypothetical protein
MTSRWSAAAAGLSSSAAPATKSDTTASIGMPPPAIKMPVWPLARKSTATPRARSARVNASAVYFLPNAQSVPTVSKRRPERRAPLATGIFAGGVRMSISRRPNLAAVSRNGSTCASLTCIPDTRSSPASSAPTRAGTQAPGIRPPGAATPITSELAPRLCAWRALIGGSPVLTVAAGKASSPTQRSPAQSRRPKAVLA